MKWITSFFLLLIITSTTTNAQNCDSLVKKLDDKFTGKTGAITRDAVAIVDSATNSALLMVIKKESDKTIYFKAVIINDNGLGCIDDRNKIYFIFDDSSRYSCLNFDGFNCDGDAAVPLTRTFGNKKLKDLLTSRLITSIRIDTSKSYYEADVDPDKAEIIRSSLNCILSMPDIRKPGKYADQ